MGTGINGMTGSTTNFPTTDLKTAYRDSGLDIV